MKPNRWMMQALNLTGYALFGFATCSFLAGNTTHGIMQTGLGFVVFYVYECNR